MPYLPQFANTTIKLGPFVDSINGNAVNSILIIQKSDVRLSRNGANFVSANADQGVGDAGAVYNENGYYSIALNNTDTSNCGRLKIAVTKAGALPVWADYDVIRQNTYNSLIEINENLWVDVQTINSQAVMTTQDPVSGEHYLHVNAQAVGGQYQYPTNIAGQLANIDTTTAFTNITVASWDTDLSNIAANVANTIKLTSVFEGTNTVNDLLKWVAAFTTGQTDGANTGTVTFYGLDGVTARITMTVDSFGNRSAVTRTV